MAASPARADVVGVISASHEMPVGVEIPDVRRTVVKANLFPAGSLQIEVIETRCATATGGRFDEKVAVVPVKIRAAKVAPIVCVGVVNAKCLWSGAISLFDDTIPAREDGLP